MPHAQNTDINPDIAVSVNAFPFYVSSPAVFLPESLSTAKEAVADGKLTQDEADGLGIESVREAPGGSGPELAVLAATDTLRRSGFPGSEISCLVHSWIHHSGHDLWSPAHYIAHQLDLRSCTPFGAQHLSNGAALSLDLAASWLATHPGGHCLVTTGDVFPDHNFDRWACDYGVVCGDGGTAALVSTTPVPDAITVHAVFHASLSDLEVMHRCGNPLGPVPEMYGKPIDIRRAKRAYFRQYGTEAFASLSRDVIATVIRTATGHGDRHLPGFSLADAYLPRIGRAGFDASYAAPVQRLTGVVPRFHSNPSGHIGSGDLTANCVEVLKDRTDSRRYSLMLSAGAGFTWTAMLVSTD
jgi:3-oxoacyl-[acyl-carrier-protein] synthase-3